MKNKTYHNIMRAAKMIQAKGYSENESIVLAQRVFDNLELYYIDMPDCGITAEQLVDKILTADEYKNEQKRFACFCA